MICLFEMTASNIKTNEDYRKIIKKKSNIMKILILLGTVTILVTWLAIMTGGLDSDSFLCGLYFGLGCGLVFAGIIMILKLRKISSK